MSREQMMSDLKEKVESEIKRAKKVLYIEEISSFISASIFAANLCCVFMLPFSGFTFLNLIFGYVALKHFKPTVKRQIMYHKHLEMLNNVKKEKIWTQNDK